MKLTEEQKERISCLQRNYYEILDVFDAGIIEGRTTVTGITRKDIYKKLKDDINQAKDDIYILSIYNMCIFEEEINELEENTFYFLIGRYLEKIGLKMKKLYSLQLSEATKKYQDGIMEILGL